MPLDPISYSLIKSKISSMNSSINSSTNLSDSSSSNNNSVNIVYSTTEPTDKDVIWFDLNHDCPRLYNTKSGKWGYMSYVEGYTDFDNNLDGCWTSYISIPIITSPVESTQYKIKINGNTVQVYANDGVTVLTSADIDPYFWNSVQLNGSDIRVFDEAFTQKYFWIDKFDLSSLKAIIWVKIDAGQEYVNIAYGNNRCLTSTYNNIYSVLTESISNLIGCWHFNENTGMTTQDFSGQDRDGTLTNSVTWTTNGYYGNAISFSGGYVQIANSYGMDGYSQLTVISRVYPTSGGIIFNKEDCYELAIANNTIEWAVKNSRTYWNWINTGITLNLNEWYTIAWVYENASSIKTYVYDSNGNLRTHTGSWGSGNIRTTSYSLRIGNRTSNNQPFNGIIDEVYMFDRALTQDEIEIIRRGLCRGNNNGALLTCKYTSDLSFGSITVKEF